MAAVGSQKRTPDVLPTQISPPNLYCSRTLRYEAKGGGGLSRGFYKNVGKLAKVMNVPPYIYAYTESGRDHH